MHKIKRLGKFKTFYFVNLVQGNLVFQLHKNLEHSDNKIPKHNDKILIRICLFMGIPFENKETRDKDISS